MKTLNKSALTIAIVISVFTASSIAGTENSNKLQGFQHIKIDKKPGASIPRNEREQRLVNEIKKMPDLIPVLNQFDGQGIVKVKNIGKKKSAKSFLKIDCDHQDKSRCPELDKKNQARYRASGYPDDFMVKIPKLNPGQTHSHRLPFWNELEWGPGHYIISFKADATNTNREMNETNNIGQSTLSR